ncbi:MAG: hypothetical protein AVDCRST_MAG62-893 [uncultured Sphingomonas sp.]|jgi:hypothetical protein|uniref:Uncharacterized protein n=1 Tax=uncultured Sphingomonas sp. TaxID=158754 RepID=A0A6J4T978_9SPHN|nr:MAG: hypothetical protein AVDCRST_MAG62-893 [uncultured Sphingomonas sp.]
MDAFSYLSVLLSIILGLAVQQVLQGYRALILSRRSVRFYPLPLVWSVLVLAMVTQHWWASFALTERTDWSFAAFATTLVQTGLIYMLAAIVLPDVSPIEQLDLKDHYFREVRAFFGMLFAAVAWSVLREWVLEGRLPERENLIFHLVFLAFAAVAALSRRERVHQLLTSAMAVLFIVYIAALFSRLG